MSKIEDRELLELAARACGDRARWYCGRMVRLDADGLDAGEWGNPLIDDGDALRLAVVLRIRLRDRGFAETPDGHPCVEGVGMDEFANTRRAIVRAAAEIGRSMQ